MASLNEMVGQIGNYRCYYGDGNAFLGMVDIEFPELKNLESEISGAGISGKISWSTVGHYDSLELNLNFRNITDDVAILTEQHAMDLSFYGAQQVYNYRDAKTIQRRVKIDVRGFVKNTPLGSFKISELTETKVTLELIFIKVEIDNKEEFYIDKLNMIARIHGVDYLSDTREAIGMDTTLGDVVRAVLT